MLRKMYQGGPSRKQGPRLAMHDADDEPPRNAPVRPCEWPSENFMDRAGIKEEFNAYLHNADLAKGIHVVTREEAAEHEGRAEAARQHAVGNMP